MKITVDVPAKINLYLDILGKRTDGYHDVEMVMQSISLCDTVTVTKEKHGKINLTNTLQFCGSLRQNTAYIASEAFFCFTNIANPGINIYIKKRIPICAGLAGGSADAAAVLCALNRLFSTGLSKEDLTRIGKKVGADVPFCICGGTMLACGIGTDLSPLPSLPMCYFVIVKPDVSISTKFAYEESDRILLDNKVSVQNMVSAIRDNDISLVSSHLYNCFEEVLKLNEIEKIKLLLRQNGALNAAMSGTGSAVFGIFDDEKIATCCKEYMEQFYKNVFLATPVGGLTYYY